MRERVLHCVLVVLAVCAERAAAGIPDTVWLDDYESCPAAQQLCPDADADDYGDTPWCYAGCQQPYDFFPIASGDCNDDSATVNPGAAEVCDGVDNDCDNLVDTTDSNYQSPPNFCAVLGECAGTNPTCTGAGGNKCIYTDPDVELAGDGSLATTETRCDGKDNNCNGAADESFPQKFSPCDTGLPGICATGAFVCNGAQDGLRCAQTVTAKTEKCGDGLDNDCDGQTDEAGCTL